MLNCFFITRGAKTLFPHIVLSLLAPYYRGRRGKAPYYRGRRGKAPYYWGRRGKALIIGVVGAKPLL